MYIYIKRHIWIHVYTCINIYEHKHIRIQNAFTYIRMYNIQIKTHRPCLLWEAAWSAAWHVPYCPPPSWTNSTRLQFHKPVRHASVKKEIDRKRERDVTTRTSLQYTTRKCNTQGSWERQRERETWPIRHAYNTRLLRVSIHPHSHQPRTTHKFDKENFLNNQLAANFPLIDHSTAGFWEFSQRYQSHTTHTCKKGEFLKRQFTSTCPESNNYTAVFWECFEKVSCFMCFMFHVSCFMCSMFHFSFFMFHFSFFMFHVSFLMFHVSCFIFHVSCFIFHVSFFMFHVSFFMFHVSFFMLHVLFFMLHVSCLMFQQAFVTSATKHTPVFLTTIFSALMPTLTSLMALKSEPTLFLFLFLF